MLVCSTRVCVCVRAHWQMQASLAPTGPNHGGSRITELAAYCPATGQGISTLLHIGDKQVPAEITRITGINNDMVHQPHLPKIWCGTPIAHGCVVDGHMAVLLMGTWLCC